MCGAVWCQGGGGVSYVVWCGVVYGVLGWRGLLSVGCCVGCWGVKGGGVCEVWLGGEVQCSVV